MTEENNPIKYIDDEYSLKYLLEEFKLLYTLRDNASKHSESRVNIYLAIATVFIGAVVWIERDPEFFKQHEMYLVVIIITSVMFWFGFTTFLRLLESHVSIISYTRGINRIRGYFKEHSEQTSFIDALSLPPSDNEPVFGGFGYSSQRVGLTGLSGMINIINSLLAGLIFFQIKCYPNIPPNEEILIGSIIISLFSFIFHIIRSRTRFNNATKTYEMNLLRLQNKEIIKIMDMQNKYHSLLGVEKNLYLENPGDNVDDIKSLISNLTDLSSSEIDNIIENPGLLIQDNVPSDRQETIRRSFEHFGAEITFKTE